jgi:hypothetical protein
MTMRSIIAEDAQSALSVSAIGPHPRLDRVAAATPEQLSTALIFISVVLLVAEVVSPSSIRIGREVKPSACARAGIPLYLLVDRFTDPLSVTLYSEPGDQGYAVGTTVGFGEKLCIPAPFDITLDTSALPLPR